MLKRLMVLLVVLAVMHAIAHMHAAMQIGEAHAAHEDGRATTFVGAAHGVWAQQGLKLVGTGAAGSSLQGRSVALSLDGNTALVGGVADDGYLGAAWVYTRKSNDEWVQQGPKLAGTGAVGSSDQGVSVALSADGNTAIVGAYGDNGGIGAAWIYMRKDGAWMQQGPKLVGTGSIGGTQQGLSVALSGDGSTAIVGGPGDDGGAGAAWVYTRGSDGVWAQQGSKLLGTGAVGNSQQGYSVALSSDGNTALVGGIADHGGIGAAWSYVRRSDGVWTQQGSKLVGTGAVHSAQGVSVALAADGKTAVVGGPSDTGLVGAVWVYTRQDREWEQQGSKLVGAGAMGSSYQGISVALSADGNTVMVGGDSDNGYVGAAWVYSRSHGEWTQQGSKLVGAAARGSYQGVSVALSGDGNTAIVGAYADNAGAGAARVYVRTEDAWTQQGSNLIGTDAQGSVRQGYSVALSADGNTAVVGAPLDSGLSGAAWVYTRKSGAWAQRGSKLVGTGAAGHAFQGLSVAMSADGKTALVGADYDDGGVGAAWVYTRGHHDVWTQQGSKLLGTGAIGTSAQGVSVALSANGNTAIVGGRDDDGGNGRGAAWVFIRNEKGVWAQQGSKLVGTGAIGSSLQGRSAALSADGNTALVGGIADDGYVGAAWVYTRSRDGVWAQQGPKLVGTGAVGTSYQGVSVALSADGNTAIVGGYLDNAGAGAAWVYARSPNGEWAQQGSKLVGTGARGEAEQGYSVALSADGNTAIVGAPTDSGHGGAAWVYTRDRDGVWTQRGSKLVGTGAIGNEIEQGYSVALSADGNTAIIGGPFDNGHLGAMWVFSQEAPNCTACSPSRSPAPASSTSKRSTAKSTP
ncbi:hypothetical protein JQ594_22015 [Bradyrhizobium manausense]|uniref:WD40 repeat domain-containing protein n=1 Tax=Bradyrhizobium manausense TaxID=989370 RepID=UPI001BA6489D|nr:hypothetical protein [Bradyrhizobium manausense]MBR0688617.1 hypothetical protein [Bradyrhizobium manausense]